MYKLASAPKTATVPRRDRFLGFCQMSGLHDCSPCRRRPWKILSNGCGAKKERVTWPNAKGKTRLLQVGGEKFILSTCRTAFSWAAGHRMLPPFAQNPFTLFPIEKLKDPTENEKKKLFSAEQEKAFFAACNSWQRAIFHSRQLRSASGRVDPLTRRGRGSDQRHLRDPVEALALLERQDGT